MGSNRKLPFGYRMEQGRITVNPEESQWVSYIFHQYIKGMSYQELTEKMKQTGIPYDGNKPWNKNMIARILGDLRYCGCRGYAQIISLDDFDAVAGKRSKKTAVPQKTEAQKLLRRKCDCRITPHVEHEVLHLLNTLAGNPDRIIMPEPPNTPNQRLDELKSELDEILARLPVDEPQARAKVMEIAAAMYEAIDPREYETRRLRKIFETEMPREKLDAALIEQTIAAVLVDGNGRVRTKLKNDQIIERGV